VRLGCRWPFRDAGPASTGLTRAFLEHKMNVELWTRP